MTDSETNNDESSVEHWTTEEKTQYNIDRSITEGDWNILDKNPIPTISIPNFSGDLANLNNDPELLDALESISRTYNLAVQNARDTYQTSYNSLVNSYTESSDNAWNTYSSAYMLLSDLYDSILAEAFSSDQNLQTLQSAHTSRLTELYRRKEAQLEEIFLDYAAKQGEIYQEYLIAAMTCHEPDENITPHCWSGDHTDACVDQQINALEAADRKRTEAASVYYKKVTDIQAQYYIDVNKENSDYKIKEDQWKNEQECLKNERLTEIRNQAAELAQQYRNKIVTITANLNELGQLNETYTCSIALAWQSANVAEWSAMESALAQWTDNTETDPDWATYVTSVIDSNKTAALGAVAAYVSYAQTCSAADKTALSAQISAQTDLLDAQNAAELVCNTAINGAMATMNSTISQENNSFFTSVNDAVLNDARDQIKTSQQTRQSQVNAWKAYELARITIQSDLSRNNTTAARQLRDQTIDQDEYDELIIENQAEADLKLDKLARQFNYQNIQKESELCKTLFEIETKTQYDVIEQYKDLQLSVIDARGIYDKAEKTAQVTRDNAIVDAGRVCDLALSAASKVCDLDYINADSVYNSAILARENQFSTEFNASSLTFQSSALQSIFTSLGSAVGSMNNAAGNYYSSGFNLLSSYYSSDLTASGSLAGSLLSKSFAYSGSVLNSVSAGNQSFLNRVYSGYDTIVSTEYREKSDLSEELQLIDAQIVYWKAVQEADTNQMRAKITAGSENIMDRIQFLTNWANWKNKNSESASWPEIPSCKISIASASNIYGDDFLYSMNAYFSGGDISVDSPVMSPSGVTLDPGREVTWAVTFAGISLDPLPDSTIWGNYLSISENVYNIKNTSAYYAREAEVADADYVYAQTGAQVFRDDFRRTDNLLRSGLTAQIGAERSLNSGIWDDVISTNSALFSAARSNRTASDIIDYLSESLDAGIDLDVALAETFGDFQIDWRADRLAEMSTSDPHYELYAQDLAWAESVVELRNAYLSASGSAIKTYASTIFTSLDACLTSIFEATVTRETVKLAAARSYSESEFESWADYTQASYDALSEKSSSYLDAELEEYLKNSEAEKTAKRKMSDTVKRQADDSLGAITDLLLRFSGEPEPDPNDPIFRPWGHVTINANLNILKNTPDEPNEPDDSDRYDNFSETAETIAGYGSAFTNLTQSASGLRDSEISAAKSENEIIRENAEKAADAVYNAAWRAAVNAYLTEELELENEYEADLLEIDGIYDQARQTAQDQYESITVPAGENFSELLERYGTLFNQGVTAIDNGEAVSDNYITDPNSELEVCFVAGTPILMADGTSKPIEKIRPGDLVLSVDHNDPENDTPKPAKVTRFFDNGFKDVSN